MDLKKRLKQQEEIENSFFEAEEDSEPENQNDNRESAERRNSTSEKVKKEKKKGMCSFKLPQGLVNISNKVEVLVNSEIFS